VTPEDAMADPLETIPAGYGTVTPWIISTNAAGLIAFLQRAFDGELIGRVGQPGRDGRARRGADRDVDRDDVRRQAGMGTDASLPAALLA
jgi:hypothetical protein